MSLLSGITFHDVCLALLAIGLAERILLGYAPATMVGRNGWLIRGEIDE